MVATSNSAVLYTACRQSLLQGKLTSDSAQMLGLSTGQRDQLHMSMTSIGLAPWLLKSCLCTPVTKLPTVEAA